MSFVPTRVIVHCADTPDSETSKFSVSDIERWHKKRKFTEIGYHYYIDRGASIWEGRSLSKQGAGVAGENHDSIHICLEGRFKFTEDQIRALMDLYQPLFDKYDIAWDRWFTHNHYSDKSCPGFCVAVLQTIMEYAHDCIRRSK